MNDIAIKVENLSKIYRLYARRFDFIKELLIPFKSFHTEHHSLQDVSFTIKKGETVGIIGKNGAGKSTLLKILTGVLSPTSGSVQVNGKIASLLELGAGFNPEMTGTENIYFNGAIMGYTDEEMEQRIDAIVEFADIGEYIHQPVKTYSSGMFARLAFAVAIHVEPDILIIDEALSVGDIFFIEKCIHKINEIIKKNQSTLIFVSHDLTLTRRSVDRCLWFEEGKKIGDDKALHILDSYAQKEYTHSPFTARKDLSIIQKEYQWQAYKVRFGTGKMKITSIQINNETKDFNSITTLSTGTDVSIKIYFSPAMDNQPFPVTLSIAFFDDKGINCFGISPKFHDVYFDSKDHYAECLLKDFPLLRGRYSISIGIWDEMIVVPYDLHERAYDVAVLSERHPEDGKFLPNYYWSKHEHD